MIVRCSFVFLLLLASIPGYSRKERPEALRQSIQAIVDTARAHIGIGVLDLDTGDSLLYNGADTFPMQSVFKFPLAVAMLHQIEQEKKPLSTLVNLSRKTMDPHTWGPLLKEHKEEHIHITIGDLLDYSVKKSDNNACDALFRLAGGTGTVNRYIRSLGITGMTIRATEAEMRTAWPVQYTNSCRPGAMLQLLQQFYRKKLLSPEHQQFLWQIMTDSENPSDRIKGLLPANAVVTHKTGTSDTNEQGLMAATNDVGIISLPNGKHIALVVFVSDFKGGTARAAHLIALVAKAVWDHYSDK
ncbi:class A beta-lactamase [Taibaiella koreensis]|uniref:class A beta-lactamase n=1 Tax=Taibaiella koreensis TaxID=1268548 RepID=UPI000E59AE0F|nr:class A beta-lactamase [Taibaiella koreensis]